MERKRKRQKQKNEAEDGPSKQQLEIAKHIRFKTPSKGTQINKQDVTYFNGSKAIDTIMASKWSTGKGNTEVMYSSRSSAVEFMNFLLENQFFYRAMKNKPTKDKKKDIEDEKVTTLKQSSASASEGSPKSIRQRKKNKTENESKEKATETKNKEKGKVKKKYKLTVHEEQIFVDSSDIYIWVYSPTHPKNIALGILLLCGVIGATLFPLWPPQVRTGVYYLSMGGAGCIGSIFVIALLRSILFAILWVCTMGNIHLWILPNILADVGFFDSFKPWYTYENKKEMTKEKQKEKLSDDEEESAETNTKNEDNVTNDEDKSQENSAVENDEDTTTS